MRRTSSGAKRSRHSSGSGAERPFELEPTHSPEGVDLTLIRWMLTLTPRERLEALQDAIESIRRLRGEAAEG